MIHALNAEQAVLGAVLLNPQWIDHAQLSPAHFYDPTHAALWEEMQQRYRDGRLIDEVALMSFAAVTFREIGGVGYLVKLMGHSAAMSAQVAGYGEMIRDCAHRRDIERAAARAAALAKSGEISGADVQAALEDELQQIAVESDHSFDAAASAERFIESMDKPSISTGIRALDERLGGLHRGELVILAGRPSMGKTALANQISRNVAERGGAVHFGSLEMPKEQLAARAMSAFSLRREYGTQRVQYYHLRNGSNVDRGLLRELKAELPRSLVIDDRAAQTLAQLEHSARATRRQRGRLDLIVVDYLQLMRATRSDGRVNEVSEISAGLKAIAKRLDVPVLALSQLSRQVENRENKRPQLSDLRESGSIEQDADAVCFVYRESYYLERAEPDGSDAGEWAKWKSALERCKDDIEVITAKQRGGPTGTDRLLAHLAFDVVRDRVAA
jgi:replicative DNA helicase